MDPFTQKLLARTQARKDQLVKKREELQACRAKRNSPNHDRSRRPLSEDNTDSSSSENDEIKRRRLVSEDSGKDALLKATRNGNVNSPSVQARKEQLIKMQQKDQENAVSPKKHWKPLSHGLKDSDGPSIASRSAAFETNTTAALPKEDLRDKKQSELKTSNAPSKLQSELKTSNAPSKLAEARGVFESNDKQTCHNDGKEKLCAPPKPPRLAEQKKSEQHPTKRKAPSPPWDKSDAKESASDSESGDNSAEKVVKRKAPQPPVNGNQHGKQAHGKPTNGSACKEAQKTQAGTQHSSTDDEAESNNPVPAKRERKSHVDTLNNTENTGNDQPTPTPRKKLQTAGDVTEVIARERGPTEVVEKVKSSVKIAKKEKLANTVSLVAKPVNKNTQSKTCYTEQKVQEPEHVIQACVVEEKQPKVSPKNENTENLIIVKAVPCSVSEVTTTLESKQPRVTEVADTKKHHSKVKVSEKVSDGVITAVAMDTRKVTSKKTRESKREDFSFKIPDRPSRDCHFDPNETVNLNDVNIHDITFNFDFGKFDQEMEKERESMFKMTYEENFKQMEMEEKRSGKMREGGASASLSHGPSALASDPRTADSIHQSGYNSKTSEQYAAKTTSKVGSNIPQRPKRTQDAIKSLLEEAAYQQNIVLQASRAVNLCITNDIIFRGSQEEIEAERVLLLATEHRTACLDEVQRLKTTCAEGAPEFIRGNEGSATPCRGTLSFSDIKIHLRQDFMDVLRVGIRNDRGVFYFVCIVQHGPREFFCSKVLSTNDVEEGNSLTFSDKFTVKDITPDFNVAVKIFCMNIKKNVVNTTPTAPKHKIFQSPKVVKGMFSGRRATEQPSPVTQLPASPHTVFRTSSFSLIGVTNINLPIIKSRRFSLDKVPESCPLNCYVEMKAVCSPWYSSYVKGFLTILEDIGGYGAWQRRWCVLDSAVISYWRYPGDETTQPCLGSINLGDCTSESVTRVARDLCARPNTMELKLRRSCGTEVKYLLAADTKTDRATWIDSLNEALKDWRAWMMDGSKQLYPDLSHLHSNDVYMCSKTSQ